MVLSATTKTGGAEYPTAFLRWYIFTAKCQYTNTRCWTRFLFLIFVGDYKLRSIPVGNELAIKPVTVTFHKENHRQSISRVGFSFNSSIGFQLDLSLHKAMLSTKFVSICEKRILAPRHPPHGEIKSEQPHSWEWSMNLLSKVLTEPINDFLLNPRQSQLSLHQACLVGHV